MDVKPGYKRTQIGVVPEDWEVKCLGEIGEALIGLTYSPVDVSFDGLLVLRSSNIVDGRLSYEDNVFVQTEVPERIIVREGDILICVRNGSRALIGKCAKIDKHAEGMTFGAFMAVFRTDLHDYVFYQFQSSIIERQIHAHLGATINQITNASLNSFLIPLPPTLAEQQAIAEALSDVDALISALDRLIAKKRAIKQGAMQELLTGRRRLPGFSGEWEVRYLGSILQLRYGKSQRGIATSGGDFPVLATSGEVGRTNRFLYDMPSVIIGRKGTIDAPLFVDTPFWAIDTTYYSEISELAHPKYLYYLLTTFDWYAYNEASGVPSLSAKTVHSIEVSLPPVLEQQGIAAVLSDMDAEIAALEQRRDKTKLLKQGMMQELLTGRIRLL